MRPVTDWNRAADPARRLGHAIEHHAEIGSTNDRARLALLEGGGEGLAVVADFQSAGRGRRGRTWASPAGANLMLSVAFRPRLEPARAGLLGLAAALAVRDVCEATAPGAEVGLRWPNDVVTADGLKLAGLLLETTLAGDRLADAVIGIGINANWRRGEMPEEIAARATSLSDLAGEPIDRVALLRRVLDRLDHEVGRLEAGASPVAGFRAVSVLEGRAVRVEAGDAVVEGIVAGIAPDGALLLDAPDGRLALTVGEVVNVRDRPAEVTA